MKFCVIGIPGLHVGKHNIKDSRLDQADKLVEAQKKTYVQVDLVGEESLAEADAILVSIERRPDLILQDLEFVETRLSRDPSPEEKQALVKIQNALENDRLAREADLSDNEKKALVAHAFVTQKPIVTAANDELANLEALLVRLFQESGYISFLTVGGKENRAWPIRKGSTAWDAAGVIHSDIQKGFIRAEIIRFTDFIEAGGETQAKRAGKLRLETKTYVMQDYDLTNFRFNK